MSFIKASSAAFLIIDVQEALISTISGSEKIVRTISMLLKACHVLSIPIYITEQYPKGLGPTISPLKMLGTNEKIFAKTTFSAYESIAEEKGKQWLIVGIESHICVLQTVKDLVAKGENVTVIYDGIGSHEHETNHMAIEEMRNLGARITSAESILYEILRDSSHSHFKAILELVKTR